MARLVVAAVLALAPGCKEKRPPTNAELLPGEPAALEGRRCRDDQGWRAERGHVGVRVAAVAGAGVSMDEVGETLRAARDLLADQGIVLLAAPGRAARIDDRFLFAGTVKGVTEAMKRAGQGASRDRIIAREVAGPLVALLKERAGRRAVIDVVVVERIAGPRSPINMMLTDIAGLAVSLRINPGDRRSLELQRALAVPDRVPTVLLSTRELARLPRKVAAAVAAHEIGHLLGLEHHPDRANLMAVQRHPDCWPVLGAEQRDTMAREAVALHVEDHE